MLKQRFLTRTFFELYSDPEIFYNELTDLGNEEISDLSQEQSDYLYMLIASKYGDSNVRYTNERLFSMNLFRLINTRWPKVMAWERDQKKLRETEDAEFRRGGKTVMNQGAHNTADVSTDTTEGINQLDSQAITNMERGQLGVLQERLAAYKTGEEDKFLKELNPLFIQIIAPMADLLYGTEKEEE